MWIIVMLAACLVPALVFLLARSGAGLRARQAEPLPDIPRERWPRTGLVIPAAGSHPAMESLPALPELSRRRRAGHGHGGRG